MTQLSLSIPDWMIIAWLSLFAVSAIGKVVLWLQERKLGKLKRENDRRLIKHLGDENIRLENQIVRQREIIERIQGD